MLSQDQGNKKARKIFLDIIAILLIISCILISLSFFGISIGVSLFSPLFWLIFLISVFKFAKLTKKYGYIILFFLFIIGIILSFMALNISLNELTQSGELANIIKGQSTGELNLPTTYYIYSYLGAILNLISLISMIVFYFKYYRKYLSGEKTLYDLGVQEARDEQQFTKQWQEKEKKQNKIGIIIIIILILIFIGVLIYLALM